MIFKTDKLYIPVIAVLSCITGIFYIVNYPRRQFMIIALLMLSCLLYGIYRYMKEKTIGTYAFMCILLISFLLKADYVIYTPNWVRQHDVIGFGAGFGQAGFIEYFYEKLRLIDFDPRDYWGYFQPPLHHMIAGLWLRLMNIICPNYGWACENVQLLTLFYSAMIGYVSYLIIKDNSLHNLKQNLIAFIYIALHPIFILMSGSINNDVLCVLLQLCAMYFFLKYCKEENGSWVYIILTAITLGLSMMTKLSAILIAPAIGCVMLYRLIGLHKIKGATGKATIALGDKSALVKTLSQYLVFGFISIPIGVWSPVRNLILFGVPLNYTPEVGEPLSQSLVQRIFDIRTSTPFTCMIDNGDAYDEFNLFLGCLKTSLFGEYTFKDIKGATFAGWVLLLSGAVIAVWLTVRFVKMLFDKKITPQLRIFCGVYAVASIVFYINLCLSIPNFSSLDFRYIAHLVVLGGLAIANGRHTKYDNILYGLTIVFAISSIALYMLAGLVSYL